MRVHEVAPRDGLQNEKRILTTEQKLALLRHLVETSPASIEVTSFVRADLIPALADADDAEDVKAEVIRLIKLQEDRKDHVQLCEELRCLKVSALKERAAALEPSIVSVPDT